MMQLGGKRPRRRTRRAQTISQRQHHCGDSMDRVERATKKRAGKEGRQGTVKIPPDVNSSFKNGGHNRIGIRKAIIGRKFEIQ